MYPRNAASPERIAVGAVILIADGTVQTSAVSITVVPQGGASGAGGGTTSYEQGVVFYLPTQAETNYTSFIVTAYKASCIPVSVTVVTTASVTPGKVVLSGETHTSAVIPTVSTLTGHTAQTGDTYALANGATGFAAIDTVVDAIKVKTDYLPSATAGAAGGLFIAGTNAPVTITGSGNAFTITSTGADGHGIVATGNGTGHALALTGGETGDGARFSGGATSGYGMYVVGSGNNDGLRMTGAGKGGGFYATGGTSGGVGGSIQASGGNKAGLYVYGAGTGAGIYALGGETGHGIAAVGGGTSGDGINATVTSGAPIRGDITGDITGTITTATNLTNNHAKYAGGAVWIGPAANTNTVSYVDGIITNPVSTIAAALTIATALGLRRFHTIRTGASQIGAAMTGYAFDGTDWSVTTTGGSRDVGTSSFANANVVGGTFAATSGIINWQHCDFDTGVSVGPSEMYVCAFDGTLTLNAAGNYNFIDCVSTVAGTSAPVFAVPAGTVNISFRRWSGGIHITGITTGTTISIDGVSGGTVTLEGADGTVVVRGMFSNVVDSRTGSPTLTKTAVLNQTELADAVWDELTAGHAISGSTGEALAAAGTAGDPWITTLPGSYSAGQAGYIVGTNLDAQVSTAGGGLDAAGVRAAVGLASANLDTQLTNILTDTAEIGIAGAGLTNINLPDQTMNITGDITGNISGSVGSVTAGVALSATGSAAFTEGYRADGATGTLPQLLYEIVSHLGESGIVGTKKTIKKLDGTTTAAEFTLDDATTPTSITRSL